MHVDRRHLNLAGVVLPIFLAACASKPQEEQLREWVAEAVGLAERGDAAGLLELTTGDFRVSPGGLDRRALKLRLYLALKRLGGGSIHYPRADVELSGDDQAEVGFAFVALRGREPPGPAGRDDPDDWLAALADKTHLLRIHLWLRREGGDWLASQARLERFTGTGFAPVR